jgi:hypothetical protein
LLQNYLPMPPFFYRAAFLLPGKFMFNRYNVLQLESFPMVQKLHSGNAVAMPAKQLDCLPNYAGLNLPGEFPGTAIRSDRRNRVRAQVHWPVVFVRDDGSDAVETTTQNLTSEGFYCLSSSSFIWGEQLTCCIKLPAHDPAGREQVLWLECRIRVARVDPPNAEGVFGVACQIEDYHFAYKAA